MKMQDFVKYSETKMETNFTDRKVLIKPIVEIYKKSIYKNIVIIASGSSYNAALMAKEFLINVLKLPVQVQTPEYTIEFGMIYPKDSFVIVISQSGSSTNIIHCLKKLKKDGIEEVSLTGNLVSEMAQYSHIILDYGPGNEYVDFVTTGVQTLVEYLIIFGIAVGDVTNEEQVNFLDNLHNAINSQSLIIQRVETFLSRKYLELSQENPTFFCGNGPNLGACKEGALKFQETLKRPTMYYEIEEFLHGPDMQLTPGYTVFLLDKLKENERIHQVFQALKLVTSQDYMITTDLSFSDDSSAIVLPMYSNEFFSSFYFLPVLQYVSAFMTNKLDRWDTHPFFDKFDKQIPIKTADYSDEINMIKKRWEQNGGE